MITMVYFPGSGEMSSRPIGRLSNGERNPQGIASPGQKKVTNSAQPWYDTLHNLPLESAENALYERF